MRSVIVQAVDTVGEVFAWLVDDLDSSRAREIVDSAPLSALQSWLVVLIELVFLPLEIAMAVFALALAPSVIALAAITFGPNIIALLLAGFVTPAAWFVLRRPRAEVKSLLFKVIALRAHAAHSATKPGAIGSSSSSSLAVPTLSADVDNDAG